MRLSIAPLFSSYKLSYYRDCNQKQDNLPIDLIHRQAVQRVIHDATCVRGREFEILNSQGTFIEDSLHVVSALVFKLQASEL